MGQAQERVDHEFERYPSGLYLPLDSWVYSAFERLAALGYAPSGFSNMRPWTRSECARVLAESRDLIREKPSASPEATELFENLQLECPSAAFQGPLRRPKINLNSFYLRTLTLQGPALNDGYHFGQTLTNDYGRISREGENIVAGLTGHGSFGPMAFYFRGEYQASPSTAAAPEAARQAISTVDNIPLPPGYQLPNIRRFRQLEAYVVLRMKKWQVSFGKQDLWWGPGAGGAILFSNNAEPITMLHLDRVSPMMLPGPLSWLGKIRLQTFWGVLDGHDYVRYFNGSNYGTIDPPLHPHPFIHGEKLSIKPSPNLEFSVSETTIFSGPGYPLTWHTLLRSYGFSNTTPGQKNDPGDRRAAFDVSYRIPGVRDWLTIYLDSFTEDEISPIGYPRRSAMNPGIYLPRIPKLPKVDFRAEGVYTDLPGLRPVGSYYWNAHYVNGYTNSGQLIGSWIGRQGTGIQAWSTYWFSPQSKIQVGYRQQRVSRTFLKGGTLRDINTTGTFAMGPRTDMKFLIQGERWDFPLLSSVPRSNFTLSVQMNYRLNLSIP